MAGESIVQVNGTMKRSTTMLPMNYLKPKITNSYKVIFKKNKRNIDPLTSDFFFCSYIDQNTSASIMLKASTRWLAIRGDILSICLLTSVSAGALFATQSPGSQHCKKRGYLLYSVLLLRT